MRVILDTNVLLDILQNRMPFAEDAVVIFRAVAADRIAGFVTAKQIADLHFFARKMFRGEENTDAKARAVVAKLLSLFDLIDTLGADCRDALGIGNSDYEDAMLIALTAGCISLGCAAAREKIDCIVTRNADHFRPSPVPIRTPAEFAAILNPPASGGEG